MMSDEWCKSYMYAFHHTCIHTQKQGDVVQSVCSPDQDMKCTLCSRLFSNCLQQPTCNQVTKQPLKCIIVRGGKGGAREWFWT